MMTRMLMTLTIDAECPEKDIEDAFPPIRLLLLRMGLGPWKWSIEDFGALEGVKRQRPWSPKGIWVECEEHEGPHRYSEGTCAGAVTTIPPHLAAVPAPVSQDEEGERHG